MKKMIINSVILVFFLTGILFGQDYFSSAQKAFKKKDYDAAYKIAKEAYAQDSVEAAWKILLVVKENIQTPELFDILADVNIKKGITEYGIIYYQEADKLDSLNVKRKFTMAEIFLKSKDYTNAVNMFLKIERIDPNNSKAISSAASIFFKAKMWPEAALYYDKVLKFNKDLETYLNSVRANFESKNFDRSLVVAKEGIALFPKELKLARYGYMSAIKTAKWQDALNCVLLIPDSDLSASEAKTAGDVANVLQKDSLNIKYYKLAAEKDPNNKDLFVKLADNAYNEKKYDQAIDLYNKKLAIDPKHEYSLKFKAYSYLQKEDYPNAIRSFLDWMNVNTRISDTTIHAYLQLADCYEKADSSAKKAEIYSKLLKMMEGNEKTYLDSYIPICYYFAARAAKASEWNVCINYAQKIISLREEESALILLTSSYYNLKNIDKAVEYVRKAKRIAPNNKDVKDWLRRLSED